MDILYQLSVFWQQFFDVPPTRWIILGGLVIGVAIYIHYSKRGQDDER